MSEHGNLQRFIDAQKDLYPTALAEIKAGRKKTHWMWFIFPQLQGLGSSETSKFYGIKNAAEAEAFLNDTVLGNRLFEACSALLELKGSDATRIFGSPDDMKLRSCMTLFASLNRSPVFDAVLAKFFKGEEDESTLRILNVNK